VGGGRSRRADRARPHALTQSLQVKGVRGVGTIGAAEAAQQLRMACSGSCLRDPASPSLRSI
jgi:hypothetical protein